MSRWLALLVVASGLAACTVFGPPAVYLTRSDIAQRAFVDRDRTEWNQVLRRFEGLTVDGPDVGIATQAQRLELEWTLQTKQTPIGIPLSISITISGSPELNATRTGIDLADARIERVRLPSLPLFDLGAAHLPEGESLGRMPLLAFRSEELNRDGVLYQATGLALGPFGLRVDLAPK